MKNCIVFFMLIGLCMSCSKNDIVIDENNEILGEWELIEVYNDPGDGSGEYMEVESDKKLEFFANGTVTSNGSFCTNTIVTESESSGTFSLEDQVIIPDDCPNDNPSISFTLTDGILWLSYICIEGCGAKYAKVQ